VKAVFGLGNPGREYRQTRHNLGFLVIDRYRRRRHRESCAGPFVRRWRAKRELRGRPLDQARVYRIQEDLLLVKPRIYMNRSGLAVRAIVRRFELRLEDCLIVCDDLALPWGRLRARAKGSAGGHGGLASIIAELGTEEIPRLRIGIGREGVRGDLAPHVLGRFTPVELRELDGILDRAAGAIDLFVEGGIARVMDSVNRAEPA
jgi:PTH1 family peptidyl-tRNA hydrolase